MTILSHEIRAKQRKREELQRQVDEWIAAGNSPLVITRPPRIHPWLGKNWKRGEMKNETELG